MNVTTEKLEKFMHVLMYVFGLLLITEWLRPVDRLTDTGNLIILSYFCSTPCCCIISACIGQSDLFSLVHI
ncbi:hypothetical protein KEH51_26085 [[Brevibacterium] frigoritolerans]|uniref:Uncharacterized protein n=1 Tax=Peribacillus frigoritolerans TaxID=450367 RepID=A0A941FNL9_9BACI|nr:hypothetical protein [Peribacillus frigoritolerans]